MDAQSIPRHIDLLGHTTRNMTSSDLMTEIVSLCPDAIIGVDRKGIITIFNEAAETTTGWLRNEVIGRMSITHIYRSKEIAREIKHMLYSDDYGGHGRLEGYETVGQTRSGKFFPIRLSAILLYENGVEVGSVGFFHDLTPRKRLENKLRQLSITDNLTGLFNQRHFSQILGEEISRAERYQRPLTLVLFDLDNLKLYNDTFGHYEGDNVLKLTSRCAGEAIRESDYAFRQGGDEFALLLVETDLTGGLQVAERFRHAFNKQWKLNQPFGNRRIRPVSLSLGVAEYRLDESPENLLIRADMAMYDAKRSGGNQCKIAIDYLSDNSASIPAVVNR